jgi:hypothetical protein
MAEVKVFDRHRRFKKYLAMEDARARSLAQLEAPEQSQCRVPMNSGIEKKEGGILEPETEMVAVRPHDKGPTLEQTTTPKLLSLPPRRPRRNNEPNGPSLHPYSNTTHGSEASYENAQQAPPPTYPMTLPLPLPPPFSQGARVVSDEYSLPSVCASNRRIIYLI